MPQTQTTTATTVQQSPDVITGKAVLQGSGIVTTIFTIAGGLLWLRRKFSTDRLEVRKDTSEGSLLEILMRERNGAMEEARDAWAKRASDAEMIGSLSAKVDTLNRLNSKTNSELHLLRLLNQQQTKEIAALRAEISGIREQLKTCSTCPLRKQ